MKRVFVIGGLSESGKSTVGRYLDSKGIIRWKFVAFYKEIMKAESSTSDFNLWQDQTIRERPDWLWGKFIELLKQRADELGIEYCAFESLYSPELARALRAEFGLRLTVIYVDIPTEIRLQRQIIRRNLKTIEEAKEHLLPRDKDKVQWGALQIKDLADIIIDNSGTIEDLYNQIERMLKLYCPELG